MRALILALLMLVSLPAWSDTNVLENEDVRLEVSPQNGSIIHLVDKRTGTDYINDQAQTRLFRFLLPQPPDNLARRAMSNDQKVDSVQVENGSLKIHFPKLRLASQRTLFQVGNVDVPVPEYDIEVTVSFRLDGPHVLATLEVQNRSLEEITDVTFPWLGGLALTSGTQRPKVVIPAVSQKVIPNTGGRLFSEFAKCYPSELAASWINYEFPDKGVGIQVRSSVETQDALLSLNPTASTSFLAYGGSGNPYIAWNSYPHIGGQSRWVSPDAIIHVHGSDWHTIASEHREWYRQQSAPSTAGTLANTIGFATYRLKRDDNTVNWTYDEIPKLAEEAKAAGIRHLLITGWREREGPGNPYPFAEVADPRMGGGARLKTLIESLRVQGVELAFAFHPTLINTAAEQYESRFLRWPVKTRRQGHQMSPSFIFISQDYPYEYSGYHYGAQIDPASPATDYLLGEAKRLKEDYGFRNLFLRGVGLQSFLSYNLNNAVLPQETYKVGYERFLGGLRKLFPEGLLFTEGFNDLVNQYGNAGYTWRQSENPEVLAFSLPWTPFSNDVEALDYDEANASFARKILINLIVDGGDGTVGRYVDFARHLKALQALKEAAAPYYAQAEFRDHEGVKNIAADSGVVLSTFLNRSSQQMGVIAANLTKEKKAVSFELGAPPSTTGRLFRMSGKQEDFPLSPKSNIGLGPFEVAIVGIDLNR